MMKSDNTVSEKCKKKKKKKKNLHIVAARYAIYSPAIQMYPSYIKLAVNISAMFTFTKSDQLDLRPIRFRKSEIRNRYYL